MTEFTSPAVQAMNLIRYIGDEVSKSGEPLYQLPEISEQIGAPSRKFFEELVEELSERSLIRMMEPLRTFDGVAFRNVALTLEGWEKYEAEKRGEFAGNYGFLAMQFDEPDLIAFVNNVLKPAVKDGIGYDLVDMNDAERTGILDNIMRVQIRDAAFVIADLTHDNSGAYWEAGYAEGLGKPVLYICEKAKFEEESTHFDTNHCTTIPWCKDDPNGCRKKLIATLRRSLDLPS